MCQQFKQFIYFFYLFANLTIHSLGASNAEPAESPRPFQEYTYGTCSYYSAKPVTVADHLKKIATNLDLPIYWLFTYGQKLEIKQKKLGQLTPLDDEWIILKKQIFEDLQELNRLSNCHYEHARVNTFEYVDPYHVPKDLAWRFGILSALYGNFQNELIEKAKSFEFHKASLLCFSYSLGLSNQSPAFLQHTCFDEMISDSQFITDLNISFQKEFSFVDETKWVQAIQELDQQELDHICKLFRSIYHQFLQHRESLPKSFVSIAAQLNSILAKVLLQKQTQTDYNFDAVNPWMFKLYIDLNKWKRLKWEDEALVTPDLETLLPKLEKECLRLMPHDRTLKSVTAENETVICEEVRMRNLLPTSQNDLRKGEEIIDEFEFSPFVMRQAYTSILLFLDKKARFARGYEIAIQECNKMNQQIYNYLSGYIEMNALPITEENALDYLLVIKLFDMMTEAWNSHYPIDYEYFGGMHLGFRSFDRFYFPRTTFELRKKILKLCPHLRSFEALTLSVNPEKVRDEKEQITPGAWIDESEKLRQQCFDDLMKSAQYLSDRMDQSPLKGVIIGTRGMSGAGKSTFVKRHLLPLILPEEQRNFQQIDRLAQGILNPDTIKAALKKLHGGTLNTQIHDEGSNTFHQLFRLIADRGSYILDKRHLTPHEIVTNLVKPAKNQENPVWFFDFDISLTTCISRILARPLHGDDPCPECEVLIDGFLSIRRYRAQVIALAIKEETIAKYELYATSKQCLVAHKKIGADCPLNSDSENSLCIHNQQLLDECLKEPTYQEIEEELSQIIDDSFISNAITSGEIAFEQRESLEKWKGMTLKKAIQLHVQEGKGICDECQFEPPALFPFNGKEWLADFPELIAHLHSEHLLNLRGVDEKGRGLHWEAEQWKEGLNPKYYPDTKAPGYNQSGIQMKIGYFIVPMENLDLLLSKNLSPAVARELTVRTENGELIGLRFFVHPEAYTHFTPLLQAGISFVPPSESEFMGTPTSSYHSWLIRRVSTADRKPFIVKMGTPNGQGDIKHLFSGDAVIKSLSYQKQLDKLPDQLNFVLFKETAGIILKDIHGYPAGIIDSGIVICEVPEILLTGECKIFSLAAVTSCERMKPERQGIATLDAHRAEMHKLPLIFELMEAAIQKGIVKTTKEFLQTYFINAYLQAIEPLVFQEGYSIVPQGHNLYLILNSDNTIKGFAYRDLEGLVLKKKFLESYSWFYRYANFIKLLNVITQSESQDVEPPPGGPIRAGIEKPLPERNLYHYLYAKLDKENDQSALGALNRLSITSEESLKLLKQLDDTYLTLLKRYFTIDEAAILNSDGTVPCAEKGSLDEKTLSQKNQILWENRITH